MSIKHVPVLVLRTQCQGKTSLVHHEIVTDEKRPIKLAHRNVFLKFRPWSSSVILVKKNDASIRSCVYYRKLNPVTKKYSNSLPKMDDNHKLIVTCGYCHVEIAMVRDNLKLCHMCFVMPLSSLSVVWSVCWEEITEKVFGVYRWQYSHVKNFWRAPKKLKRSTSANNYHR